MDLGAAVQGRYSCRAFLPDGVGEDRVRALLALAAQAPSGGNLQPWEVVVLAGDALQALKDEVVSRLPDEPRGEGGEYRVYPENLKQPYFDRRYRCGEDLYATLAIAREDKALRLRQFRRNFEMFGAPVGVFVFVDRQMQQGQWADLGMFCQTFMLAAVAEGLATCAQEAWAAWPATVARHAGAPADLMLFCGIALGHEDPAAPVNRLRTERAGVDEIARFRGF